MGHAVSCPLCLAQDTSFYHSDPVRDYYACGQCRLVFVPEWFRLSPDREKSIYNLHQNSSADEGYRRFLGRLFEPMQALLEAGSYGLDFGSGPGPTLSAMFVEAGHEMAIYDCYYADDPIVFDRDYDFITASEVIEHLYMPAQELARLWALLKPGGLLGIMTKRVLGRDAFTHWHYKNDPTHVCFFSMRTFDWLAEQWGAVISYPAADVVILKKTGAGRHGGIC